MNTIVLTDTEKDALLKQRLKKSKEVESIHASKLGDIVRASALALIAANWILLNQEKVKISHGFKNSLFSCLGLFIIVLFFDALQYLFGYIDAYRHRLSLNEKIKNLDYKTYAKKKGKIYQAGISFFWIKIFLCFFGLGFFIINFYHFANKRWL